MRIEVFERLIELKDEELQGLRLDMEQLGYLLIEAQGQLETAQKTKEQFVVQCRESEGGNRISFSGSMIERRNYLRHLVDQSKQAEQSLREVSKQYDSAHRALEKVYVERRSIELFAERKRQEKQLEERRQQFMAADDEELRRIERTKVIL